MVYEEFIIYLTIRNHSAYSPQEAAAIHVSWQFVLNDWCTNDRTLPHFPRQFERL